MSESETLEFTGETIDEAVERGCEALGVKPGDFIVEVLEEPHRGVFGIGARPARVRLKLLRPPTPPQQEQPKAPEKQAEKPQQPQKQAPPEKKEPATRISDPAIAGMADEDLDEEARVAKEVVMDLMEYLNIRDGRVVVTRAESSDQNEKSPWMLNIEGRNVNALIGKRGDTLSALQYIVRLICSRRLQRRANIVIDADGYKQNRAERLKGLAIRMADQASETSRTITLEPMPPHERRMIHMTLRSREDVFTKSTGEGSSRKVMIVPK